MKDKNSLNTENDVFSSSLRDDLLVVRQKRHILHFTHDINKIFSFYDYLDSILSSKKFRALVVFGEPQKEPMLEYVRFLCDAIHSSQENKLFERLFNVVNRLFATLSSINGITVFAGRDHISLFQLNLSLAYDFRVVAEGAIFENLNADIGLITKGSGYFMARLLGVKKATDVLQWRTFSAEDALQLGLVDRIVPAHTLEEETMEFVRMNLQCQTSTLLGIRKLLKCDQQELKRSLDFEDQLIKERLESSEFKQAFENYCLANFGVDMETLRTRAE